MADVSPEAELALLLTGTSAMRERMRARIAELADNIDEDAFVAFLRDQRMVLLGGKRFAELAPHASSARLETLMAHAQANARVGAMVFAAASRHMTDSLETEGVPAVFEIAGREYVTVPVGGEGLFPQKGAPPPGPSRYVTFALPAR